MQDNLKKFTVLVVEGELPESLREAVRNNKAAVVSTKWQLKEETDQPLRGRPRQKPRTVVKADEESFTMPLKPETMERLKRKTGDRGEYILLPRLVAQSSLFTPLGKGRPREILTNAPLVCMDKNYSIRYTGCRLEESDRDVLLALIAFGMEDRFSVPLELNRRLFLRHVRANANTFGSTDYAWLSNAFKRLAEARLEVTRSYTDPIGRDCSEVREFRILKSVFDDGTPGMPVVVFDPSFADMMSRPDQCVLLNWRKREKLLKSLAGSMQAMIASVGARRQSYPEEFLLEKHNYHVPLYKVRPKIDAACDDLLQAGIIRRYGWSTELGMRRLNLEKTPEPTTESVFPSFFNRAGES